MNIAEYFVTVKERLLTEPSIVEFQITRERATVSDGYLRARLILSDGSWLEFSEYVQRRAADQITVVTYSYHWVNSRNRLIQRWDNTPHFPTLAGAPHHIHTGDDNTVTPGAPTSIFAVLDEIARRL